MNQKTCKNCNLIMKRCDFKYCPDCGTKVGLQTNAEGLGKSIMREANEIIKDYDGLTIGKSRFSTEQLRYRIRRVLTEAINGEIN